MIKSFHRYLTLLITGFLLVLGSCTPQSCLEETEAKVKIYFYDIDKKLQTPDSITVFGLQGIDSVNIYKKAVKVQPALLPLNAATDNCTFIIKINAITDTLRFNYSSFPHLVSKECGYTFYHHLDMDPTYSSHGIKSINLVNANITTINEENISIYY